VAEAVLLPHNALPHPSHDLNNNVLLRLTLNRSRRPGQFNSPVQSSNNSLVQYSSNSLVQFNSNNLGQFNSNNLGQFNSNNPGQFNNNNPGQCNSNNPGQCNNSSLIQYNNNRIPIKAIAEVALRSNPILIKETMETLNSSKEVMEIGHLSSSLGTTALGDNHLEQAHHNLQPSWEDLHKMADKMAVLKIHVQLHPM
jgi:hypothetical protein